MKFTVPALVLLQGLMAGHAWGDCTDAARSGFDSHRYAQRIQQTPDEQAVLEFLEQAQVLADKALTQAQECGCNDAESLFYKAFRAARAARKTTIPAEREKYLRQLLQATADGTAAADRCGQ